MPGPNSMAKFISGNWLLYVDALHIKDTTEVTLTRIPSSQGATQSYNTTNRM